MCFFMFFAQKIISQTIQFTMPKEETEHEGTWLQWPHQYEYGITYRNRLDATWVAITKALVTNEKVHIIAYNATEQSRITNLLTAANVPLANIDFYLFPTNDVWVRDNGPVFVFDNNDVMYIEDWGFNGWGGKFNYNKCNPIPTYVGNSTGINVIDLNSVMVLEGGAIEIDGNGVLMATKSSILSQSPPNSVRNPGMSVAQAESFFTQYLGVNKFIWLDGVAGDPDDVTDMHIDGFAKFTNDSIIVTMNTADLTYWGVPSSDINILYNSTNINGKPYSFVFLPLTQNNVVTTYGNNLGYKGSYVNYYIANKVVLVPNYNDPNDVVANSIIQNLYPNRNVIGIDCRNLYENGGMVHCVTQQQPQSSNQMGLNNQKINKTSINIYPNPASSSISVNFTTFINNGELIIYNVYGKEVKRISNISGQEITFEINLSSGMYFLSLIKGDENILVKKFLIVSDR